MILTVELDGGEPAKLKEGVRAGTVVLTRPDDAIKVVIGEVDEISALDIVASGQVEQFEKDAREKVRPVVTEPSEGDPIGLPSSAVGAVVGYEVTRLPDLDCPI